MVSKDLLLELLPVRDQVVLIRDTQTTDDIRQEILTAHTEYQSDYDKIEQYFDHGDIVETCRGIFDFLKSNVPYGKESGRYQTIKSPALILSCNDGTSPLDKVDCKNYASFIAGVLDAIKRKNNPAWTWCYRFASYDPTDPEPGHVFVAVTTDQGELWVDPVFPYFNQGDLHDWELDETPKAINGLYRISGPNDDKQGTVVVNTKDAATNFLIMVQNDAFSLGTLLLRYPQITNSPQFLQTLKNCGVSLDALRSILAYVANKPKLRLLNR